MTNFVILASEERNQKVSFQSIQDTYQQYHIASQGYYYPYNHCIDDFNWGCAWRAIQMFLSFYQIQEDQIDFLQLYKKFSNKAKLLKIIRQRQLFSSDVVEQLKIKQWTPEESPQNWADPFVAYLIAQAFKIKTKLYLINGACDMANEPEQVFSETINFDKFKTILQEHFKQKGPIMIDDGEVALTIIGFKQQQDGDIRILMGDPHIKSNREYLQAGIYEVVLDSKGRQKQFILRPEQQQYGTYLQHDEINFFEKNWMVLQGIQQTD